MHSRPPSLSSSLPLSLSLSRIHICIYIVYLHSYATGWRSSLATSVSRGVRSCILQSLPHRLYLQSPIPPWFPGGDQDWQHHRRAPHRHAGCPHLLLARALGQGERGAGKHPLCATHYMHTYIHAYIQTCMHTCMHTCIHTCIVYWNSSISISLSMSIFYIYLSIYLYIYIYICVCVYVCVCARADWRILRIDD